LMHNGSSLLKHAVAEAVKSNAEQVIVVLGANADIMMKEFDENEVRVVMNTGWAEGMASSIRAGINALLEIAASADAAILMPCDQPYVSASLLNDLMSRQEETGKRIIACDYGEAFGITDDGLIVGQSLESGITGRGNAYEDFAVQESMGPIVDRSQEYLGTCDRVIYRARKLLLEAVKRHHDTGELSFATDDIDYRGIRAVSYAYPSDADWREIDPYELQEAAE